MAIKLRLTFGQDDGKRVQPWKAWGEFFEAETRADMIISYPWLAENHLAVLPEFGCLALRKNDFQFFPLRSCSSFEECNEIETGRAARSGFSPPLKRPWKLRGRGLATYETAVVEVRPLHQHVEDLYGLYEAD